MEYVPHPATWLNGERWEDELPVAIASSHASHQPAQSTPLPARTTIPEHVRAVLAKLRGA
jgi:DNA replication protein DnaC